MDAVIAATAFHWFDGPAALVEIHRVLKPGGFLGLIWNARGESVEWVAKLTEIIDPHEKGAPRYKSNQWKKTFETSALFSTLQLDQFYHEQCGPPDMVADRVASISFIAALPEDERSRVLEQVRSVLKTHPLTAGKSLITFPYRTDVFWTRRL